MYRFRCDQLYRTTCTKAFPKLQMKPDIIPSAYCSSAGVGVPPEQVSKLRLLLPSACLLEQQLCPHIAPCHSLINCYSNYYYYCPGHVKKTSFWHIMGRQRYLENHILSKNTLNFSIPLLTSVIISDCRAFFLAGCITELSASDGQQEKVGNLHVTCDLCKCASVLVQFEELLDVCDRSIFKDPHVASFDRRTAWKSKTMKCQRKKRKNQSVWLSSEKHVVPCSLWVSQRSACQVQVCWHWSIHFIKELSFHVTA